MDSIAGSDMAADVPGFLNSDRAEDLGFSLDWSEQAGAEQVVEAPAGAPMPTANPIADDLGFTLDWSEPQPDPYAGAWAPSAGVTTEDSIITTHWDDPTNAVSEPALFSESPTVADATTDGVTENLDPSSAFDIDPAQSDLEQASPAALPTVAEERAEQDEAQIGLPTVAEQAVEQESAPWYAPTVQLDDHLPVDSPAIDRGHEPFDAGDLAWAEQPAASGAPADDQAADTAIQPLAAADDPAWAEQPAESSAPADDRAATAFSQLPNEALEQEPTTTIDLPNEALEQEPATTIDLPANDLVAGDANQLVAARLEPATEVSAQQIARIIGMIQSYGPAWFKMWSLELKERPERLPVVLGEVTADPALLAQAADPQIQSALLLALAAYTSPAAFPARLPASAPLPSPAIAGQSTDGEDEVPDWLSLRVKWNGHGGGA
jgi:hypothetical protein